MRISTRNDQLLPKQAPKLETMGLNLRGEAYVYYLVQFVCRMSDGVTFYLNNGNSLSEKQQMAYFDYGVM